MFITSITNRGNIPVLEKTLAFSEARQQVLAENLANLETPGYRAKQLDSAAFQSAMRRAIDDRGSDPHAPLQLPHSEEFHVDQRGRLQVTPTREPAENILFHDRTNARIERYVADLADNIMAYTLAAQMLKGQFDGLKMAIRGTV